MFRCGLNYCSLECFKSDRHQDCSEAFYKAEVEKCLKSDKISEESKMQMVEMLKRDKIERELEDENVPGGVFFYKNRMFHRNSGNKFEK